MKFSFNYIIRSASLLGLVCSAVSCVNDRPYQPPGNVFITERRPRYGWQGTDTPTADTGATEKPNQPRRENRGEDPSKLHNGGNGPVAENPNEPEVKPEKPVTDPTPPPPVENVKPKPNPTANLPFGTPVIGKKGFVYSPFAPDKGMVDVSDIPSGTKVECPYTKKIFRVP